MPTGALNASVEVRVWCRAYKAGWPLVTGASRGIGTAIARRQGFEDITADDRDETMNKNLRAELGDDEAFASQSALSQEIFLPLISSSCRWGRL